MVYIKHEGWVEFICGSMFSGKSEELIRRVNRAKIAKQNVLVFKPSIDDRYSKADVIAHNGAKTEATPVAESSHILQFIDKETNVVAIDEVQFFDMNVINVANELADRGIRVICAGLDQDFRAEAFGPSAQLLATADYVTKLQAICMKCGGPANRTQRLINGEPAAYSDPTILVGASESYEARCRHCHQVPSK